MNFMSCSAQAYELSAAQQERRLPFWPRWMCSRWGQWLARNWAPVGALWRANVELARQRELDAAEHAAALDVARAVHWWAEAGFKNPPTEYVREDVIRAWCKWRMYHETYSRLTGVPAWGSIEWTEKYGAAP